MLTLRLLQICNDRLVFRYSITQTVIIHHKSGKVIAFKAMQTEVA